MELREVVLVHGALDESASFQRLLQRLHGWDVTTYDRRGWGRSRGLGAVGLDTHVDDLVTLLPERPAFLVGHSYGGTVAIAAAAREPDRVRAVCAYEPPVPWLPSWPERAPWERLVLDEGLEPERAPEALLREVLGDATWERLPRALRDKRRGDGRVLVQELRLLDDAPPAFDPSSIRPPVLVAAGTESPSYHRLVCATLADLIERGRYEELRGAGHGAHVSDPAAFAGLLEAAERLAEEGSE